MDQNQSDWHSVEWSESDYFGFWSKRFKLKLSITWRLGNDRDSIHWILSNLLNNYNYLIIVKGLKKKSLLDRRRSFEALVTLQLIQQYWSNLIALIPNGKCKPFVEQTSIKLHESSSRELVVWLDLVHFDVSHTRCTFVCTTNFVDYSWLSWTYPRRAKWTAGWSVFAGIHVAW